MCDIKCVSKGKGVLLRLLGASKYLGMGTKKERTHCTPEKKHYMLTNIFIGTVLDILSVIVERVFE